MQGFSTFQTVHAALQYKYNQQALAKGDGAPDQVGHCAVHEMSLVFPRHLTCVIVVHDNSKLHMVHMLKLS